ncbi:redox-sensing transcriptional repressor Rex [Nocardia stercoris]|uniref:Redox-sensing transcriptional repressor Rex n=1 Tax=Nocardia stercoris TaxID=2483361 RepID=A0A3M2KZD8_9NOCA|nr:redox-sensing transcriptional repressor Rex [Nocardia stercoris]RMI30857.1 redox-sensing transcriptional repressor Rex [Nocardia stercoris]
MTEQHEPPTPGVSGKALGKDIPQATVSRLATYLRVLTALSDEGVAIVSSEELAVAAGVGSAKLRKDLSFLGPNGVRGVGYDVAKLCTRIEGVLGLSEGHRVILVGAGHLGRALARYGGFARRGFTMVGIFDHDPQVIGTSVGELIVRDIRDLAASVGELEPTMAVLAVPDGAAQQVCDALVAAGVHGILSFSALALTTPPSVEVRRVDLGVELQMLSFEWTRTAAAREDLPAAPPSWVAAVSTMAAVATPIRRVAEPMAPNSKGTVVAQ